MEEWIRDMEKDALVTEIVAEEWDMFQRVNNAQGRAECQDNWKTFNIMRASQLEAWGGDALSSYLDDIRQAKAEGVNLLSEKYAYMMENTAPDEFREIQDRLQPVEEEKRLMVKRIVKQHVEWMDEMVKKYPGVAGRGRPVHASLDSPYGVSFETYLGGELYTYSVRTLEKYYQYALKLQEEGKNINEMILLNTAKHYGYSSLEEAEREIKG
jgi:hypothetical protein